MIKMIAIIFLLGSGCVFAQTNEELLEETAVVCASHHAIAAVLTESKLSKMGFSREGKWWRSLLEKLTNKAEAERRVFQAMEDLRSRWNSKEISWEELLNIGENCSQTKLSLQSLR